MAAGSQVHTNFKFGKKCHRNRSSFRQLPRSPCGPVSRRMRSIQKEHLVEFLQRIMGPEFTTNCLTEVQNEIPRTQLTKFASAPVLLEQEITSDHTKPSQSITEDHHTAADENLPSGVSDPASISPEDGTMRSMKQEAYLSIQRLQGNHNQLRREPHWSKYWFFGCNDDVRRDVLHRDRKKVMTTKKMNGH